MLINSRPGPGLEPLQVWDVQEMTVGRWRHISLHYSNKVNAY